VGVIAGRIRVCGVVSHDVIFIVTIILSITVEEFHVMQQGIGLPNGQYGRNGSA
jgi:hypothetical protein